MQLLVRYRNRKVIIVASIWTTVHCNNDHSSICLSVCLYMTATHIGTGVLRKTSMHERKKPRKTNFYKFLTQQNLKLKMHLQKSLKNPISLPTKQLKFAPRSVCLCSHRQTSYLYQVPHCWMRKMYLVALSLMPTNNFD